MREFWKKRLPALALAALMLAGSAIPAAATEDGSEEPVSHEDHTPRPGWGVSNDTHWQVCSQGGEALAGTEAPHAYGAARHLHEDGDRTPHLLGVRFPGERRGDPRQAPHAGQL